MLHIIGVSAECPQIETEVPEIPMHRKDSLYGQTKYNMPPSTCFSHASL